MKQTTNTRVEDRQEQTAIIRECHGKEGEEPMQFDELIADLQLRIQALEDFLTIK